MAKISLHQWLEENANGVSAIEFMCDAQDILLDSIVPALCDEGCEVEPDGHCEHGAPAITLALGVI